MILKRDYLYCFHNPDSKKAYCLIHLPSFKVSTTSDCKTQDHTFKLFNLRTVFHFASETASEMNEWIKRLNFASVSYPKKFEASNFENCFSESDDSGSETLSSCTKTTPSTESNIETLPDTLSATSLDDQNVSKPEQPLPQTVTVNQEKEQATDNNSSSKAKETDFNVKPSSSLAQNANASDSTRQTIRHNDSTYPYAQLAFPPPSPRRVKKSFQSPKIPPKNGKYLTMSTAVPPVLPPRPDIKIGLVSVLSPWTNNQAKNKVDKPNVPDANRSKKPTPQPRTSKLKSTSTDNQDKLPSLTNLTSSETLTATSIKTVENPLYLRAREIANSQCSPDSQKNDIYVSFLDKEYNKLFGNKSPGEVTAVTTTPKPKSATSEEIANLYLTKSSLTAKQSIESDSTSTSEESNGSSINRSVSATKLDRSCNSPISNNSLSSSSGISSYYSSHVNSTLDQANNSINSLSSPNPSYSSSLSTSVSEDTNHGSTRLMTSNELISSSNNNGKYSPSFEKSSDQEKCMRSPSSKSTFRLFSSPKLLKKFSTPKYQKERNLERKDGGFKVAEDETQSLESKLIVYSPPLTRTIFGLIGRRNLTAYDNNALETESDLLLNLNRSSSESSLASSLSSSAPDPKLKRKKVKPNLKITIPPRNEQTNYSSEGTLSPGTPRKPTMGIAMIGKKRSSNVSSDKNEIEAALAAFKSEYSNASSNSPAQETFTIEDKWANVVKIIEEVGLTLEGIAAQDHSDVSINKPLDDESVCRLVLNLRDVQKNLKVSFKFPLPLFLHT